MATKILVVDDNEDAAEIAAHMLRTQGFATRVAHDGLTALGDIAAERPDCVLLDIMMPGMSGLEVLEKLREDPVTATLPVVMVTAKSHDKDVLEGYKRGADYYLTKPFNAAQLIYGVRLVLGETDAPRPDDQR